MKTAIGFALAFVILLISGQAYCGGKFADAEKLWKDASEAYLKDDYKSAAAIWQDLVNDGHNGADLQYNLACAYHRAGKLGYAVLNYEKALADDSDCADCRTNLELALKLQRDQVVKDENTLDERGVLEKLMQDSQADTFAYVFLPIFLIACFSILLRRFVKSDSRRFAMNIVIAVFCLASLLSGSLLAWKVFHYEKQAYAVVIAEESTVKEGPDANFKTLFTVHEGLKVRLGETVDDWRQIWLENGLNGYLPASDIGEI